MRDVVERQRLSEQKKAEAAEQQEKQAHHRASMAHMPTAADRAAHPDSGAGLKGGPISAAEKASRRRSTAHMSTATMSELRRSGMSKAPDAEVGRPVSLATGTARGGAGLSPNPSTASAAPLTPSSKAAELTKKSSFQLERQGSLERQNSVGSSSGSPKAEDDAAAGEVTPNTKKIRLLQRRKSSIM